MLCEQGTGCGFESRHPRRSSSMLYKLALAVRAVATKSWPVRGALYCQTLVSTYAIALPQWSATGLHLQLNSGATVQRDVQYSADSIRLTQLREEFLHGTQALRFVREKDKMISMGDADDTGCRHCTFN